LPTVTTSETTTSTSKPTSKESGPDIKEANAEEINKKSEVDTKSKVEATQTAPKKPSVEQLQKEITDLCNQIVKITTPKTLGSAVSGFSGKIYSSMLYYKQITTSKDLFASVEALFKLEKAADKLQIFRDLLKKDFLFTHQKNLKLPENLTNPDYKFPGKSIFIHCIAEAIAQRELLGKKSIVTNYESIAKELGLPREFEALKEYAKANKIPLELDDYYNNKARYILPSIVLHIKSLPIIDILNDKTKVDERQVLLAKLNSDDILDALKSFARSIGIDSQKIRESTDVFSFIPQNTLTEVVELAGRVQI